MPVLDWIGKKQVINHDKEVPFRLLKGVEPLSVGESENLIIKGDNLTELFDSHGLINIEGKINKIKEF